MHVISIIISIIEVHMIVLIVVSSELIHFSDILTLPLIHICKI
jgi:hypothetical protein